MLVAIAHEGTRPSPLEAVRGFAGETWLITGAGGEHGREGRRSRGRRDPGDRGQLLPHRELHLRGCGGPALQGEDVSGLGADVSASRAGRSAPRSTTGSSSPVPAATWRRRSRPLLKLREGHVAAEAHHTEQLLHGHLAAIDPSVRCFVLEGEGRAAKRAVDAMRALGELGCDALLVPTTHPVVDIVRFQRLTCDLAEARGIDPDLIRWDEEPWDRPASRTPTANAGEVG